VPKGRNRKANMAKHNNKKIGNNGTPNGRLRNFSLAAPKAASVQLVGDFTQWQQRPINMQKGADGIWSTSVELPRGSHPYRFLVDGQWQDDPECPRRVPNPYGGQNAICEVG
jgi:1,4-alpha-glucan branching enzyme